MIWAKVPLLMHIFRGNRRAVADHARRWRQAFIADPELVADVIRLSGIMAMLPERLVDGVPQPDPIDPHRLAYDQGQRDLAMKLLALGGIGIEDLNQLIKETEDDHDY